MNFIIVCECNVMQKIVVNKAIHKYVSMALIFSGLHMGPWTLELMYKDMWLRNQDSLKIQEWAILWWKRLHGIIIRVNFMQYK